MPELLQIKNNTYCFRCNANVGVYKISDSDVYFIDSSSRPETAQDLLETIVKRGWRLLGIINTHAHADHNGGNAYLQQKTGCKIFSGGLEAAVTENTLLNTVSLIGGFPPEEFKSSLLYAKESRVLPFLDPAFPKELEIISLPGHSADMVGIRTPDNVVFTADALISERAAQILHLTYIFDIEQQLKTLQKLKGLTADVFMPSHSKATKNINQLIDINEKLIFSVRDDILKLLTTPLNFEDLLAKIITLYNIKISSEQYVLTASTLKNYLGWMKNKGLIDFYFLNNMLLWKKL